jgi:hypothetical protein
MNTCPTCGRRHRPRRISNPEGQLTFTWPVPVRLVPPHTAAPVLLLLMHGCTDPDGDPRPALLPHGARRPIMFPTIAAALAAKRDMEGAR